MRRQFAKNGGVLFGAVIFLKKLKKPISYLMIESGS